MSTFDHTMYVLIIVVGSVLLVCLGVTCYRLIPERPPSTQERLAATTKAHRTALSLARMEHEVLSPEYIAWAREMGDLNHPANCPGCHPNRHAEMVRPPSPPNSGWSELVAEIESEDP